MKIFLFLTTLLISFGFTNAQSINEVKIGSQVWSNKNLSVATFRNGNIIPEAKTEAEWRLATSNLKPAWCYYNFDPTNEAQYGKLYNWYAVNDSRGLAPKGWHIPSDIEWTVLVDFLGGDKGGAAKKMKSTNVWDANLRGLNSIGFNALPGGYRLSGGSYSGESFFRDIGIGSYWWSSKEYSANDAWSRQINSDSREDNNVKGDGMSVRCLRD